MSSATWEGCLGDLKRRERVQESVERSQLSPYKGHSDGPLQYTFFSTPPGLVPRDGVPTTARRGLLTWHADGLLGSV